MLLHVSLPFSREHSRVDKRKINTTAHHIHICPFGCKTLLQPFRFLSGFPYSRSTSLPTTVFLHGKCFPQIHAQSRSICPKPKRVPEHKPMPKSSAHSRTHKQAHSRKLSERQRKYHQSMASSIISNENDNGQGEMGVKVCEGLLI